MRPLKGLVHKMPENSPKPEDTISCRLQDACLSDKVQNLEISVY